MHTTKAEKVWRQLVALNNRENKAQNYREKMSEFLALGEDALPVLAFHLGRGWERDTAFDVCERLPLNLLRSLLPELALMGLGDRHHVQCWKLIMRCKGRYSTEEIERAVRPLLKEDDVVAYLRMLDLLYDLDKNLFMKIVDEALQNSNPNIVEAARDALEWDY